ncbi:Basic leucine zipper transcriptional factor ATF-like 2 [Myotis davidii]|uniref:Basic leucine zipper transcriptional factor ATF-like 2 n=1 Tax=Myotis davidii TaxID=225400 RepID=L5LDT4_MYODS|nr:Basic leucine zipper transcriptional factor ATF-like 2 [Myotis davidii]
MHICGGEGLLAGTDPEGPQRQLKKKQKNRASAQRSRRKHTDKADALHQQHEALEKHNHALRKEIQGLRAELAWWGRTLHVHERFLSLHIRSLVAPLASSCLLCPGCPSALRLLHLLPSCPRARPHLPRPLAPACACLQDMEHKPAFSAADLPGLSADLGPHPLQAFPLLSSAQVHF